jgi:hypothetical protein
MITLENTWEEYSKKLSTSGLKINLVFLDEQDSARMELTGRMGHYFEAILSREDFSNIGNAFLLLHDEMLDHEE